MIQVRRLGHATLTTPNMARQVAYYTEVVGLTLVEHTKDRAFLACKLGLEAIALEPGPANALSRLSLQVAPGSDLAAVAQELAGHGVKSERASGISPGIAEAVVFRDPKGTLVEVFADYAFAKDDGRQAGVMPLKLGHVAYRVDDVHKTVKFYCDVLGFRVSDWHADHFAFLHRNADKVRVEFFCEMDQMKDETLGYFDPRPWHQDRPQRPKVWPADTLRNYWGFGSERIIRGYQTIE